MDTETWRYAPDFEGLYEVSDFGRVRNASTKRILTGGRDSSGYPQVCLWKLRKSHTRKVHRLVAMAFLGPIPDGKQVNHKDRNRQNPRLENLEYVTPQENTIHGYQSMERRAACPRGEGHAMRVLNENSVRQIRSKSLSISQAAKRYGVSATTIKHIRAGRAWAHVTME